MSFLGSLIYGYRYITSLGATLAQRSYLNFQGAGVVVTDNASTGATDITIGVIATGATTSLESYGGGPSKTSSQNNTAFAAAFAALASLGGGAILLGAYTYSVSGNIAVQSKCSVIGYGAASILSTTTAAPVFSIQSKTGTYFANFQIVGDASSALQVGIQNGTTGVTASGDGRCVVENVSVLNMYEAFQVYRQDTNNAGLHVGMRFYNCHVENCGFFGSAVGFALRVGDYAEYVEVISGAWVGNSRAFYIGAGNFSMLGGNVVDNGFAYTLVAGLNDAHGVVSGTTINHNAHIVYAYGITLGWDFVGCHMYYGDFILGDGAGNGCVGMRVKDCTLGSVADIYLQGSTGTQFINCTVAGTAPTVHPNYTYASTEEWIGNRKEDLTPFLCGYVDTTPSNGANTLSYAESWADTLNLVAGASAGVTVTSMRPPGVRSRQLVRNNTSQTVTFGWATGGTVTLLTGTSAWICGTGAAAAKEMAGT